MSVAKVLTKPMRDALARSGYLLEQRLVPSIERLGFMVTPNERFRDPETGVTREIDISAYGIEFVRLSRVDLLSCQLLIACKNLSCPLVFFTQQFPRLDFMIGKAKVSGLPQQLIGKDGELVMITEFLKLTDFHHYYRTGRVASQFCAVFENKKASPPIFEAGHTIGGRIELFKDFDGLAKALISEMQLLGDSFNLEKGPEKMNLFFYYPIFVTAGPLVECYMGQHRPLYRQRHRIAFLYRTQIAGKRQEIRIDVVDERGLKRLVQAIRGEQAKIAKRLRSHPRVTKESLDWISKTMRRWKPSRRKEYVAGLLP